MGSIASGSLHRESAASSSGWGNGSSGGGRYQNGEDMERDYSGRLGHGALAVLASYGARCSSRGRWAASCACGGGFSGGKSGRRGSLSVLGKAGWRGTGSPAWGGPGRRHGGVRGRWRGEGQPRLPEGGTSLGCRREDRSTAARGSGVLPPAGGPDCGRRREELRAASGGSNGAQPPAGAKAGCRRVRVWSRGSTRA
jgi:hypothetical protein